MSVAQGPRRLRFSAFLTVGAFGSATRSDGRGNDTSLDLLPTGGGGVLVEYVLHDFFAIGLSGRLTLWKPDQGDFLEGRARTLDLAIVPRGRVDLGAAELYIALPLGLSLDWLPDVVGAYAGTSVGVHLDALAGLRAWGKNLGFSLEAGITLRHLPHTLALGTSSAETSIDFDVVQPLVQLGVVLRP